MKANPEHLRQSIALAWAAREHGNHPFGALLVDAGNRVVLSAENTGATSKDATAHAELNLLREASSMFTPDELSTCTLYASAEPCPMCASAAVWSNIRQLVFGLGMEALYEVFGDTGDAPSLKIPSRDIMQMAPWAVSVTGPLLEEEALKPHQGFWQN